MANLLASILLHPEYYELSPPDIIPGYWLIFYYLFPEDKESYIITIVPFHF